SDNRTKFKNNELIELCGLKGIKREYSNARTPQQNRVSQRKNKILIDAARTMLADLFLPTTFWAEAVNTTCFVLNRVLVGYSLNNKAFMVYNLETKRFEENLDVNFLENKPNVAGKGHAWMFDLGCLTNFMNYEPVSVENQANKSAGPKEANNSAGTQANDDHGANSKEIDLNKEHFILLIWSASSTTVKSSGDKIEKNTGFKTSKSLRKEATHDIQNASTTSTNQINIASTPLSTASPSRAFNDGELSYPNPFKYAIPDDPSMPHLEDIYASPSEGIFTDSSYDDEGVVWILVDLTFGKKAIKTKWVYRNKKDEKGVVVRNKARLVAQGNRQEERIDYDEKSWCDEFEELMKNRFQMSSMSELTFFLGLQVKQKVDGIFISHDKYVAEILKKFYFLSVKTASTPIETWKPLVKDEEAADVDVTPKTSHLHAVVTSFDLEAYSGSDYAGANLNWKSTTEGCQFLGRRLISWQCKKQTVMDTSTTKAKYIATAHYYG
nr:ribonuclease H-like domain-containing protein [Tanacetum cinerariifolium]